MASQVIPPRTYLTVFAALIVLTVVTVGLDVFVKWGTLSLGAWHTPISLLIATIKAGLVIFVFMHVWYSPPAIWLVALGSLLWLTILMSYTLIDYMSRDWFALPGQ